jgi:hypothetical protein
MDTMTKIVSNGSKWAGESPDSIETLFDVLGKYALDPTFEKYGNFIFEPPTDTQAAIADAIKHGFSSDAVWHFWGNFAELSHVFSIYTDEQPLIDKLCRAIRDNQNTEAYRKTREVWSEAEQRRELEMRERDAKRMAKYAAKAR